ncbi:MAG: YhbY family RNA-binding protein [Christensenellales bacterium]|jgi:RNA-binding protein
MNSKQRKTLSSLAAKINPVVSIGKGGLNESVIREIDSVLEDRELVKIKVLRNSMLNPKETLADVAGLLNAQAVRSIGNNIIIYRRSDKKDIEHIIF